jgi:hypothetical protein
MDCRDKPGNDEGHGMIYPTGSRSAGVP